MLRSGMKMRANVHVCHFDADGKLLDEEYVHNLNAQLPYFWIWCYGDGDNSLVRIYDMFARVLRR